MSEIIKQSTADIWASIGDVVMPDAAKIADGWGVEVVPRQYWNWMQNRTDTNLAYLFQHGIPEWDSTVEYIANKSYVTYADAVYKAILTGTNQNPTTATTYWKVAFATSTAALEALKETTPAADKLPYFNSASTAATTTITPLARTLLDDTTQGEMLTTVGAQPVDATLTALAGVTTATNKLPYFTGADTAATTDLTAFGRSLIDDADATAGRATLGLNNVDNTSDANKPVSVAQQAALDLKAPLLSPALTGVPTAPTAAAGTSSTQLATTAFVNAEINTDRPYSVTATDIKMDGVQSLGVLATIPRADHVHPSDTSKLSLSGGTMTGYTILSGPQATYNYGVIHDSNGMFNISRFTKAGAWNSSLMAMDFNGTTTFYAGVTAPTFSGTLIGTGNTIAQGYAGGPLRGTLFNDTLGIGFVSTLGQWAAKVPLGTNDWSVTGTCTASRFDGPLNGNVTATDARGSNLQPDQLTYGTRKVFHDQNQIGLPFYPVNTYCTVEYSRSFGNYGAGGNNGGAGWSVCTRIATTSNGNVFWSYGTSATDWSAWKFAIDNLSPNITGGAVSFSGSGSISILRNPSGFSVSRSSAGTYVVNSGFGLLDNQPAVAISNNGRVILASAASVGGVTFITYPHDTATATDSPYVCVILGA